MKNQFLFELQVLSPFPKVNDNKKSLLGIYATYLLFIALLATSCSKDKVEGETTDSTTPKTEASIKALGSTAEEANLLIADHDICLTNVSLDRLEWYSMGTSDWSASGAMLRSWKPTTGRGYTSAEVTSWNSGSPMDARVRPTALYSGTDEVLCTIGGPLVTLAVMWGTGNKLWAKNVGTSLAPHSCEFIPTGVVAVAANAGGWVRVYSTTTSNYATYTLPSAHATLWDPAYNRLWVIGKTSTGVNILTALKVGGTRATPTLTEDLTHRTTLPNGDGHDVSAFFGNTNKLWVSVINRAYIYDKVAKTYALSPGSVQADRHIKSIGNQPSGQIVVAKADYYTVPLPTPTCSTTDNWTTSWVYFYTSTGTLQTTRNIPGQCYYKARIWAPYYQ
jgi:hypothetical protein